MRTPPLRAPALPAHRPNHFTGNQSRWGASGGAALAPPDLQIKFTRLQRLTRRFGSPRSGARSPRFSNQNHTPPALEPVASGRRGAPPRLKSETAEQADDLAENGDRAPGPIDD